MSSTTKRVNGVALGMALIFCGCFWPSGAIPALLIAAGTYLLARLVGLWAFETVEEEKQAREALEEND